MVSRFKTEQSTEYQAAVRALLALPVDDTEPTYADATHKQHLESFAESRNIRQRRDAHICVERLKRTRKRCLSANCLQIPNGDHLSEWARDGVTVAILSQPYGLGFDGLRETLAFCDEHDLEVAIDTYPSFHYPGAVLSLIFTRRGFHLGQ
jgi:hypothetical protein